MNKIFMASLLICSLFSCDNTPYLSFWSEYKKESLIIKNNNQDTRGGNMFFHWKAINNIVFNSKEIVEFAKNNNWELVDSVEVSIDKVKNWKYKNKAIFPLSNTGLNINKIENNSTYEYFPRQIETDLTIYMFKTNWLLFESGTDNATDINGYVLLNKTHDQMSVYHFWGE